MYIYIYILPPLVEHTCLSRVGTGMFALEGSN